MGSSVPSLIACVITDAARRVLMEGRLQAAGLLDSEHLPMHFVEQTGVARPGYAEHLRCLEAVRDRAVSALIIAGDVQFSPRSGALLEQGLRLLGTIPWDIAALSAVVKTPQGAVSSYLARQAQMRRMPVMFHAFGEHELPGAPVYVVNHTSLAAVRDILEEGRASGVPFETYMGDRMRAGALRAFFTLPYLVRSGEETAGRARVWSAFHELMWLDSDPERVLAELEGSGFAAVDARADALGQILSVRVVEHFWDSV